MCCEKKEGVGRKVSSRVHTDDVATNLSHEMLSATVRSCTRLRPTLARGRVSVVAVRYICSPSQSPPPPPPLPSNAAFTDISQDTWVRRIIVQTCGARTACTHSSRGARAGASRASRICVAVRRAWPLGPPHWHLALAVAVLLEHGARRAGRSAAGRVAARAVWRGRIRDARRGLHHQ